MHSVQRLVFINWRISLLYLGFVILYVLQTLLIPPSKATLTHYHLTSGGARWLSLAVVVPYIIIWLIALMGYLRLHTYVSTIRDSRDGEAFATLSRGNLLLVLWPPLTTILSNFTTQYSELHAAATPWLIRLNNYFTVLLLSLAFWLLYRGSTKLIRLIKAPNYRFYQPTMIAYLIFSTLYTFLVLQDSVRNHVVGSALSSYYSPDWVIIVTLVIPRLIMWYLGLQAIQNILLYRMRVSGRLYRDALQSLAIGLGGVIFILILLRAIQSVSTTLSKLSVSGIFIVIYALLLMLAISYALISRGARNLQKIEEL